MKTLLAGLGFLSVGLLSVVPASASTITSFTVTPSGGGPFSSTLNSTFDATTARITNSSVTCSAIGTPCNGSVLSFSIQGTGLTSTTPATIAIDGTLSGSTPGAGVITLASPVPATLPFTFAAGSFNTTIASTNFAGTPSGLFNVTGTLGLTLGAGQTVNLPSSLSFTIGQAATAAPEPGSLILMGAGLIGLAARFRRRVVR